MTAQIEKRQQPITEARHPLAGDSAFPELSRDRRVAASAHSRSILTNTRYAHSFTEPMSHLSSFRQRVPMPGRTAIVTAPITSASSSSDLTTPSHTANSKRAQNIWQIARGCYALSHRVSVTTLTSDTHLSLGAPTLRSPRTRSHLMLCPPVRAARTEISVRDEPRSAFRTERVDGASIGTDVVPLALPGQGRTLRPRSTAARPAAFAVAATGGRSAAPRYRVPEDSALADLCVTA